MRNHCYHLLAPVQALSPYSWALYSDNKHVPFYSLFPLTGKCSFLNLLHLQHAQHSERSIEHVVMFKDHLIKSVQRQATGWICMFQCCHGHVEAIGLVPQRRLLGCDHCNCLLNNKKINKSISIQTHSLNHLSLFKEEI